MPVLTVPVRELVKILTATRPFTDPDFSIPQLGCIRLEAGQGVLTATSCDRYFLAHARTAADGDLAPHYMTRSETRKLTKLLRPLFTAASNALIPCLGVDPVATIQADGGSSKDLLVTVGPLRIVVLGRDWPEWIPHLDSVATKPDSVADDRAHVVLDASRLQLIAELTTELEQQFPPRPDRRSPAVLRVTANGPTGPARFEYSNWLLIMLMPTKVTAQGRVPYGLPTPPPDPGTVALDKVIAEVTDTIDKVGEQP